MADKKADKSGASRRDFMKLAGVSVPAAAVAVTAGSSSEAAAASPAANEVRLAKTDHVKRYFETARF